MEETVKKATATKKAAKKVTKTATTEKVTKGPVAVKAKKAGAARTDAAAKPAKSAAKKKTTPSKVRQPAATHEQIAALAHRFWTERGGHHGYHEEDWHRAEQTLLGKAS